MKFFFFMFVWHVYILIGGSAVTYNLAGGRLGDQLIGYMHAKWVSYKYKIPLLYKPFIYSDKLILHSKEINYTSKINNFKILKTLQPGQALDDLIRENDKDALYIIPYFPESEDDYLPTSNTCPLKWRKQLKPRPKFEVNWDDIEFKGFLQKLIAPSQDINKVKVSSVKLNVAVHVRKNSNGFDLPLLHGLKEFDPNKLYVDAGFPLKHPPEEYYIDQLKKLPKIFPNQSFYVFIFTDDKDPVSIINRFKNKISQHNFEFDCRKLNNGHNVNVLEDLFSMLSFDIFIRPDSNFSIVVSKLGNFKLTISPNHYYWKGTNLIIDRVNLKF